MSTTALAPSTATNTVAGTTAGKSGLASSVSLPNLFSTPTKSSNPASPLAGTPTKFGTPGRWQHPRLDEVIKRRNASNFDSSNVKAIAFNVALIAISFFLPGALYQTLPTPWTATAQPLTTYLLLGFRTLLLANIALALLPLFRQPDACEDVPLTPAQRKLLGLAPMSRPATPAEQAAYVTPPRFARATSSAPTTPRSSSSSLFAETGNSGSRADGSPWSRSAFGTPMRGSPFSASGIAGSPRGGAGARNDGNIYNHNGNNSSGRLNLHSNRSSPLSVSEFEAVGSVATPTKGTRASVGLNNKWLYERGRGSSMGSPGRGSVFT